MATKLIQLTDIPVSVEEAKLHLRVEHNDEDELIRSLIETASIGATNKTNRSFALTVWENRLKRISGGQITLHFSPVVKVNSVKYKDADGVSQTMPGDRYRLVSDGDSAHIEPVDFWPEGATDFRVQYLAGYVNGVPQPVVQWIMLHVGNWYKNREAVVSTQANELPFCESLIYPYKIWEV